MRNLSNRSQSNKHTQLLLEVLLVLCQAIEQLSCALGVSHIGDLRVASKISDIVETCWQVFHAHVCPVEIPVVLIIIPRVECLMLLTVSVAAGVAKPDIISCSSRDERRCNISMINDPRICRI